MFDGALAERIRVVTERVAAAAMRSGRDPRAVTVVAVSKTVAPDVVATAFELGLRDFGENRVQEAAVKIPAVHRLIAGRPVWHLVGHLQSNKARLAIQLFDLIHSVDSVHLAERLSLLAGQRGVIARALLEVDVAQEQAKHGLLVADLESAAGQIVRLPSLQVEGLMTVAPAAADPEAVRPVFRELRRQRDALQHLFPHASWRHLSMGMSGDYEVAVEEGATMVRLGRALLGERRP